MDSEEEDFVFYGTPIAREEENSTRKQKALAEASGQLRTLPAWKQEVRDEEGRRRFHGAFTGGFSAGFYNTVGSKEGWTPQSFISSRKNRAEVKQQDIFNFLDEDERAELDARSLGTNMQFDTFGFTATEVARREAEKEHQKRPSAIPGPIPDEFLAPATESIGVKLLLKMGWRRGRSIKQSSTKLLHDSHGEATKAFLVSDDTKDTVDSSELVGNDVDIVRLSESTPVYVLNPKQDLHGLGFDPFKHAPEFRDKRRSKVSEISELKNQRPSTMGKSLLGTKSGKIAPGFGIGALEDLDAEDEDVYDTGYHFEASYVEEIDEPARPMIDMKRLERIEDGVLSGFKAASNSDFQLERYDPPLIPKDFVPHHKFAAAYDPGDKFAEVVPHEAPPPESNDLKILIDGMASLVARCGKLFEDLSREKHQTNPSFSFLFGGEGHDYYDRKIWEEQKKCRDHPRLLLKGQTSQNAEKMSAESRGKLLGERPLEISSNESASTAETINLQFHLGDTFTTPASLYELPEEAKPFRDDQAKQERFEQFLKEKYLGGLRSKDAGGASKMSEAARARERLEFEAAAAALENGKSVTQNKNSSDLLTGVLTSSRLQFTSGVQEKTKVDEELTERTKYPRREEFQWRPSPLLCKRFDLTDPFMGKPPPAPRSRSKMDNLVIMPDPSVSSKIEKEVLPTRNFSSSAMCSVDKGGGSDLVDAAFEAQVEVGTIERPVDLYKAIFSDSDDDEDNPNVLEVAQKKPEAVNTTLNRLIAGDFLESLGKELGLEVPQDLTPLENKEGGEAVRREIRTTNQGEDNKQLGNDRSRTGNAATSSLMKPAVARSTQSHQEIVREDGSLNNDDITNDFKVATNVSIPTAGRPEKIIKENREEVVGKEEKFAESSEDDRRRKRHGHRRRSKYSDSDTSDSSRHRDYSRSKRKKKRSSEDNSSSNRHSKHRKHRHRDSPERDSFYGSGREYTKAKDRRR